MPEATVTVAYVNQPRPGVKSGSIKDTNGTYYGVPPAMLGSFQPKGTYEIFYEETNVKGKVYYNVKTFKPVGPAPAASTGGGTGGYKTDDVTAERIFVCGIINAGISSNQLAIQTTDLVQAVQSAREAWRQTLGKKKTQTEEELDDSIPF